MKLKDLQKTAADLAAALVAQAAKIAALRAAKWAGKATQSQLQDALDLGMQLECAAINFAYLIAHADQLS